MAVWATIIAVSFSIGVFADPKKLPLGMKFYPTFAFVRLMNYLTDRCSNFACLRHISQFNDEMWECLVFLYIDAIIYLCIGLYLDQVLPQEYGIPKHPLFFLQGLRTKPTGYQPDLQSDKNNFRHEEMDSIDTFKTEDDYVKKERSYVDNSHLGPDSHPLLIKNLKKVYQAVGGNPPKTAVHDLSLHIKKGEMFGLLGPNGAGKTSLIAMLTGLYPPESGTAWVGGYNIVNQIDLVHKQMGVCPQFDLLWPDLTVEEHLLFYIRIRGMPQKEEKALLQKALNEVHLDDFREFRTKQLSGRFNSSKCYARKIYYIPT